MRRRRKGPWLRVQDNGYYTTVGRLSTKAAFADQPYEEIEQAYFDLLATNDKPANVTIDSRTGTH